MEMLGQVPESKKENSPKDDAPENKNQNADSNTVPAKKAFKSGDNQYSE
jgi:hypothetical protein